MRAVVQRVTSASCKVDGVETGRTDRGLLIFFGVKKGDTKAEAEWLASKIKRLRVFEDENGKMNLSVTDLKLGCLIISQFTLYGDCRKGTRPSFDEAAAPADAIPLYEYFIELMKQDIDSVGTGIFGADMKILADNDGPVTVILEKDHDQV